MKQTLTYAILLFSFSNSLAQTVMDYDGNEYTPVVIGTQTWLKENLKTTHCMDGTALTLITDNNAWITTADPAYCWYNNNEVFKPTFGALYNHQVVKGCAVCPTGYKLPSNADISKLITTAGGMSVAGTHLKDNNAGTTWSSPLTADNSTGFSLVGTGYRNASDGSFGNILQSTSTWVTDEYTNQAGDFHLSTYNSLPQILNPMMYYNNSGLFLRCIKLNNTALENTGSKEEIQVYPNPCESGALVQVNNLKEELNGKTVNVLITDITGKKILNSNEIVSLGSLVISTNSFKEGIYFLNVISTNEIISNQKLIVQ